MKLVETIDKRSGIYLIDPEDAAILIEKPGAKNRPASNMRIVRYASDITKNKWKLTGEPILLSKEGHLLDGQHRLLACIMAKKPILTVVLYGAWPFRHLGQGKHRSAGDVLGISGVPNAIAIASIAKLCIQHDRGLAREASMFSQTQNSPDDWKFVHNDEIDAWVSKNHNVSEIYLEARKASGKSAHFPLSPLCAAWYLSIRQTDDETARKFYQPLLTGAGLETGDVRLLLRRAYQTYRSNRRIAIGSMDAFADIAKAFSQRDKKGKQTFMRKPSEEFCYFR